MPDPPHFRGFTITLTHTTVCRTPLDEWSARRRDLYLSTYNTHKRETFFSNRKHAFYACVLIFSMRIFFSSLYLFNSECRGQNADSCTWERSNVQHFANDTGDNKTSVFRRITIHREKKKPISCVMTVRQSAYINSAPTRRICIKYDIGVFHEEVWKIPIGLRSDKKSGTPHEDLSTFIFLVVAWNIL